MKVKLQIDNNDYYDYEDDPRYEYFEVLSKEVLKSFHTRFLLKRKPIGSSSLQDKDWYFMFRTPNNIDKKFNIKPGYYAVKYSDFYDVLNSRPHVPNKNEARGLRKKKIKEGK